MKKYKNHKKSVFLIALQVLLGLALCLYVNQHVAAQVSMDITRYDSQATIQANGDVKFIDKITYDIDSINGVLFNLDYGKFHFSDYQVGMIEPDTGEIVYFNEAASGAPRTFFLKDDGEQMRFKVYYPAQDQVITFVYQYTLEKLVTNYQDVAQFNRKVVGSYWDEAMDVHVKVILPGIVESKEQFRAWAHGAPQGEVSLGQEDSHSFIEADVQHNPAHTFVEINSIFPKSLTPNNTNSVDQPMGDKILAAESAQANKDKRKAAWYYMKRYIIIIGVAVLSPILPIIAIWIYIRKRKKLNPHPMQVPRHRYELPADITPAIMATAAYRKAPNTDDFTATIVDLARKGYLVLKEVEKAKRGVFNVSGKTTVEITMPENHPKTDLLQRHELSVLRFLYPNGFHSRPFTIDELIKEVKQDTKLKRKQYSYYRSFSDFASVQGEKIAQKATTVNTQVKGGGVFGAFVNVIIVFYLASKMNELSEVYNWLTGLCIAMFILSLVIYFICVIFPLRSATEDKVRKEWRAFERMLADIGQMNMREIASLELWQTYLVYAVALGLADKVIEAIKVQFPEPEVANYPFMMNYYHGSYVYHDLLHEAVSSSIRTATPSQSYSGSNSSGFGGGFSGGSSGGSGGGSGGGAF